MNFDFGRVEKYKPKGFGFVRSFFHEEYFFHIKKITDKNIQKYLDNNKDNWNLNCQVYFWYTLENTAKGLQVKNIWINCQDIPNEFLLLFVDNLARHLEKKSYNLSEQDLKTCCCQLFADKRITDNELNKLLSTKYFAEYPHQALPFLRESQFQNYANILNLLNLWKDVNNPLPNSIEQVSNKLLGIEQCKQLRIDRLVLVEEKKDREKTELLQKYRANPLGIRNTKEMRNVCLNCGYQNIEQEKATIVCQKCHAKWYVNHCWKCRSNFVDSRDPDTPKCTVCGWYKCKVCSACSGGCISELYNTWDINNSQTKVVNFDFESNQNSISCDKCGEEFIFHECKYCGQGFYGCRICDSCCI